MDIFEPDYLDRIPPDDFEIMEEKTLWIEDNSTCPECGSIWSEDEINCNCCDACGWDKWAGIPI